MGNNNMILEGADGDVLYSSGSGDTTVTVLNAEEITVYNATSVIVYETN